MKLSDETLALLKNYATIQPNLLFKPGNTISSMADGKNILTEAQITEEIKTEFGIYDLNEFLSVLDMFDDPVIDIDKSGKFAIIASGRSSVKYFFTAPSILTTPSKKIQMPEAEVEFTMSAKVMANLRKASTALKSKEISITKCDSGITLTVCDTKNSTSSTFAYEVDTEVVPDSDFELIFNIDNFKMLPDDYNVKVSSKMISKWESQNYPLEYFIALERSSTYG